MHSTMLTLWVALAVLAAATAAPPLDKEGYCPPACPVNKCTPIGINCQVIKAEPDECGCVGCPSQKCLEEPKCPLSCPVPMCLGAPDGKTCVETPATTDECGCRGCPTYKCPEVKPTEPRCGPTCANYCEHGRVMDDEGCPTCTCKKAPIAYEQAGCQAWNDGCNTCTKNDKGAWVVCTKLQCFQKGDPFCEVYEGQESCSVWFDGCNDCTKDKTGKFTMCTERACKTLTEKFCKVQQGQEGCKKWFDGCNVCTKDEEGMFTMCTKKACAVREDAKCMEQEKVTEPTCAPQCPVLKCQGVTKPNCQSKPGAKDDCGCEQCPTVVCDNGGEVDCSLVKCAGPPKCERGEDLTKTKNDGECCAQFECKPVEETREGCQLWNDGCNTCSKNDKGNWVCSKKQCLEPGKAHCQVYEGQEDCKVWFDGCNTCTKDKTGKFTMCTRRACETLEEMYCKVQQGQDSGTCGRLCPEVSCKGPPRKGCKAKERVDECNCKMCPSYICPKTTTAAATTTLSAEEAAAAATTTLSAEEAAAAAAAAGAGAGDNSNASIGPIVGGAVGGIALIALILLAALLMRRKAAAVDTEASQRFDSGFNNPTYGENPHLADQNQYADPKNDAVPQQPTYVDMSLA